MLKLIENMFFNYIFIALSFISAVFSFIIMKRFLNTKQELPWTMIFFCFALDTLANIFYIPAILYYNNYKAVPYPSILDWLWLFSYLLFGTGVLLYWKTISKKIKIEKITETLTIIMTISILTFIISIPSLAAFGLLHNVISDPLYISASLFAAISCIPLIKLFKKGNLGKQWLFIAIGSFMFFMSEILWIIEEKSSLHIFSNLGWTIGYVFIINGLLNIINLREF